MIADLDPFFADFSVTAVANGATFPVLLDRGGISVDLGFQGRELIATAKAEDTIALSQDDAIAIDGKSYKILGIQPRYLDGALVEIELEEAND